MFYLFFCEFKAIFFAFVGISCTFWICSFDVEEKVRPNEFEGEPFHGTVFGRPFLPNFLFKLSIFDISYDEALDIMSEHNLPRLSRQ